MEAANANIYGWSSPFKPEKGGRQLQTTNLIYRQVLARCLFSFYFYEIRGIFYIKCFLVELESLLLYNFVLRKGDFRGQWSATRPPKIEGGQRNFRDRQSWKAGAVVWQWAVILQRGGSNPPPPPPHTHTRNEIAVDLVGMSQAWSTRLSSLIQSLCSMLYAYMYIILIMDF